MLTIEPERLNLKPGDTLLDLGCGEGRHTLGLYFLSPLGNLSAQLNLIALDINYHDLNTAKNRQGDFPLAADKTASLCFMQGNGLRLPFADSSCEHIICSEVLEHINDYPKMLKEIFRVIKPGGKLCVSVPRAWPEKICWALQKKYHQVEGGHVRIFKSRQLQREIEQLGFKSVAQHGAHAIHVPYWWLRCLFWEHGESFWPVRQYHKFLIWDLFKKPWLTRMLDRLLNPLLGKSVVLYFEKESV